MEDFFGIGVLEVGWFLIFSEYGFVEWIYRFVIVDGDEWDIFLVKYYFVNSIEYM